MAMKINFSLFPMTLPRDYALDLIHHVGVKARLPRKGQQLRIGIPGSGDLIFTNEAKGYFSVTAEPMTTALTTLGE